MNSRRRIIIIFLSVAAGSAISLFIVKKRMGSLSRQDYMQLGFNFVFAVAIVVGIAILFQKTNKKDDQQKK